MGGLPFSPKIIIRLLPLARRCLHCLCAVERLSGAALDDAEHARSDLVRSWISVISLPVACFASAMYIVQSLGRLTLTVATVLGHVTAF